MNTIFMHLGAWSHTTTALLRERAAERLVAAQRKDRGAATLEYVIIAAALFVAAVGLATWIGTAIANRQNAIQP